MLNLLKMDLRHMFRNRTFYIVLAVTIAFLVLMVAMLKIVAMPEMGDAIQTDDTKFDESCYQIVDELEHVYQLKFVHECLGNGFLLLMTGIGVTLFVHGDFSSGYIKNICFARPHRRDYVFSKVLLTGIYSGIVVILGLLISLVCPLLVGMNPTTNSALDILQYAFWFWLPHWAFGLMALTLVLVTRSTTLGIIFSIVSGGGMIAILLQYVCQQFGWPALEKYLISSVVSNQCVPWPSAMQISMILVCVAGWGLVYIIGSLFIMTKRDI